VITYTCRYSSGHLIPIIQSCQDELGIKTRISASVGDHPCFFTFYNYDPYRLQNYKVFLILVVNGFMQAIWQHHYMNHLLIYTSNFAVYLGGICVTYFKTASNSGRHNYLTSHCLPAANEYDFMIQSIALK